MSEPGVGRIVKTRVTSCNKSKTTERRDGDRREEFAVSPHCDRFSRKVIQHPEHEFLKLRMTKRLPTNYGERLQTGGFDAITDVLVLFHP
jgi:hypothetical protein